MIDPEAYCRDIEAYLCRKNDGHLVRIVGPAFERVVRWAGCGIPYAVACSGIDRFFERYYRRGPRRRPVHIEFCEADVLDAFDDWRRAVGVAVVTADGRLGTDVGDESDSSLPPKRRASLAAHIERVTARLTLLRGSARLPQVVQDQLAEIVRELDTLHPAAKRVRGHARETLIDQLETLDRRLVTAAFETVDEATRAEAENEAVQALSPFRDRMAPMAYQQARGAATERILRERLGLPTLSF